MSTRISAGKSDFKPVLWTPGGWNGFFNLLMLMNAWWTAIMSGYQVGDLPRRCEIAVAEHNQVVEKLNDQLLIGAEVRELRTRPE